MADRLSALLQRFALHAQVLHSGPLNTPLALAGGAGLGHLHLLHRGQLRLSDAEGRALHLAEPCVLFYAHPLAHQLAPEGAEAPELVSATIDFGVGDENPLLLGLPGLLQVPLAALPGLALVQQLLFGEAFGQRCGRSAVVDRLVEVLLIQLLRHAIEHQLVDGGLLAGLADARLNKALNALHADPARAWTVETMAEAAGMSRARFAAHFMHTVGMPPGHYLTGWRLGLARSLLRQGWPVKQVAAEVGYGHASTLARVFAQRLGVSPGAWQSQARRAPA